ncbi:MAG: phosphoheptose isomerase [Alphaproteobacteria bacterium CG11_big_fil_rev_8_21_14_0_20_44_7]|nr:MAG: phosphoheptose isomerase [Alphaproteobacteria bacterium CG11_big_fil_rev_8_21_14_0_20_44_7]
MQNYIKQEYTKTKELFEKILSDDAFIQKIAELGEIATEIVRNGGKIMFCGNGGSAADSQHLAAELVSKLNYDRPGLNAIALTVDTSALTAIGNDYGYLKSFSRQVEALGNEKDLLIVFSTSGRSANIIEAVKSAKAKHITTIGFLGEDGRDVGALVDYQINIPSTATPKIQEGHIATGHILCGIIEDNIFAAEYKPKTSS